MNADTHILNHIYDAILQTNIDKVERLLNTTNDLNLNLLMPDKQMTVLHLAVGVDPPEFAERVVESILERGGNPNECTDDDMTPLHVAASWGRRRIVRLLLDYGADPYLRDQEMNTPLDYARENFHFDVADLISSYFQDDGDSERCPSPEMYTLKLDKVIIDNGEFKGEYVENENGNIDVDYGEFDPFSKSLYIKEWCDSAKKTTPKLNHQEQDIIRNKNGDIMFKRPLNFNINNASLKKKSMNDMNVTKYHSCNETISNASSSTDSKESSDVSYLPKKATNESSVGDDEFSSDSDGPLSGIETLKFTKHEDNDHYSVVQKVPVLDKESISTPVKGNETLWHSPIPFSHVNYATKTTLRHDKSKTGTPNNVDGSKEENIIENYDINGFLKNDARKTIENKKNDQDETRASVIEQYKYEDRDAGVVLLEKRILTSLIPLKNELCDKSIAPSIVSSVSSLPLSVDYDTEGLRNELKSRGLIPGPITVSTKKVYLKKLQRLKKEPYFPDAQPNSKKKVYTIELEKTFRDSNWNSDLTLHKSLEEKITKQFEMPNPKNKWREGVQKSSFTYLLLDPRVTNDLPNKATSMNPHESWRTFVDSIFYIGKGKRSRPYSHLYQAVSVFNAGKRDSPDKKVQHILDVWGDDLGVVCLHIFQNVIPVEAYTREAAMIEVIGLKNLKNLKPGNYYGVAASWPLKDRKLLGLYLLYRAMLIFFNEGERQLRPADICY